MKRKFFGWIHWVSKRPLAIVNLIGLGIIVLGFFGYILYQSTRPIDVLSGWTIQTSSAKRTRVVDGQLVSVYNPGESLVFTSKSIKLIEASGSTARTIICEATADQTEREIQLDTIPATRPTGASPQRENAITIPEVSQFAELPRWCKLVIDITYTDIYLNRSHTEHAESDRFLVEEQALDPNAIRRQVDEFERRIEDLEKQLDDSGTEVQDTPGVTPQSHLAPAATPSRTPVATPNRTPTAPRQLPATQPTPIVIAPVMPTTPSTPAQPEDDRSALGKLPVLGGLLDGLGL